MSSVALARVYQQSFQSHPYGTLAITNGAFNALGDVVAQLTQNIIEPRDERHNRPRYDFPRTLRFFAFGLAMGPLIGRWNFSLERNFPLRFAGKNPGKVSVPALSKRVAADQLLMAPIGLALFIGSMGLMEGRDSMHIQTKYKDLYKPALIANWQVWPVAQLINFRFMPLPYRVPFQSTCGVFWTLYLSILNSEETELQDYEDSMREKLQQDGH
ncbi:Protein SYM1 [Grifola frondosa]|uniref:Protein SYM1 n=1 Tax=Grifola frondosa TaxID=5627 RepID=A0A1C7MRZ3_GRIFR|nr:Protein SYM1 [Grifola frondosa]